MSKQRPTLEERVQSTQAVSFDGSRDLEDADPSEPTPMLVTIDKIQEYDRNPRRERNEAHDLITESIRQRGFAGALPITRRPGEPLYMVAEGGNTALHILKALYAETQDPRFHEIHCLFEPWVSESETLIAHLVENDARGELIFIDRARAVQDLRGLLEHERSALLSTHQLAALLRERGYSIDHSMIIRLLYAADVLLSLIPRALRAGLGAPQVKHLRTVEELCVRFLEHRQRDASSIEAAKRWFLECLARHDREDWRIEPIEYEVEAHLAKVCGESIAKVRADFDAIKNFGAPGPDAPAPIPFNVPERRASERGPPEHHEQADLPQDVKSLRGRMWTLATQLAQRYGLGECILICARGCGFLVDFPEHPPFAGPSPESSEEALCVMLWWMLAGLADEWPQGPGMAPALALLEEARIYPAIKAVAEGDETIPARTLVPRVGYPPSLAIAARELLAVMDVPDYERLIQLIDTRRALQAHCRRLGKSGVWDL